MKDYKKELENVLDTIRAFGEAYPDNDLIQEWIKVNFPSLKKSKLQKLKDAIFKALSKKEARDVLISEGFQVSEALDWLKKDEEPDFKFKKGDWVISQVNTNKDFVFQVVNSSTDETGSSYYEITKGFQGMTETVCQEFLEDEYRLWDISDAEPGEFLAYPDGCVVIFETRCQGKDSGVFKSYALYSPKPEKVEINKTCCILGVTPATEGQKALLLKGLKKNGYEWDGKKRVVTKIKPNDIFYDWHWFLCTKDFIYHDAAFIERGVYRASDLGIYDANGRFWNFDQFWEDSFLSHFKPIVNQDELNKNIKKEIINLVKNLYGETDDDIIKKITNDIIK